ncbi:ParB N-terminal domain-containing protein (plasmid) [Halobacteriovorax sp. GFR7]|uniref:ParB N-terminal domain-containing protein n=1 Tax=unclassified Halobacteriovorax TaxID=2639665 RepID=UPI003D97238E
MAKSKINVAEGLELRNVDECKDYPNNPRINDKAVSAVALSIKTFGFVVPIVLDKDDVIITGHTRKKAAKKLGLTIVPTIRALHLTDAQVRAFRLADNKVAELAAWDSDLLAGELAILSDAGFDLNLTGFATDEVKGLIGELNLDGVADELSEEAGVHVVGGRRVGVSVGKYKLFVHRDEFNRWEAEQLEKHGSQADVVRAIAKALGIKEAEFDDKT